MPTAPRVLEIRGTLETDYADVLTRPALAALEHLAHFDRARKSLMDARIERRAARARQNSALAFSIPTP